MRQRVEDGVYMRVNGKYSLVDCVQAELKLAANKAKKEEVLSAKQEKEKADAMYKTAKAKMAELELAELEGRMHRAEDIEAITSDFIYEIRGALMAVPGRLAIDAANAQTPVEASEVIKAEIYKVMEELSRYEYDPKKYEERVRERREWRSSEEEPDEE